MRAIEGELLSGDPAAVWRGVGLDSRRIAGGELFFALPGERTDGHRFVADALAAGAAAAVVERRDVAAEGGALILADDCFEALHRLTRAVRRDVPQHLVAITGSSGKTTTKELLARMLARRFRTAANPGNLNNLYGFPVALLGIPDDTEWMVAEMGMSTPGELGRVSRLGRPDVAVFTNVRAAHLESFGSLEAIAEAKAELLAGLAPDGVVVANADDPWVRRIAERHDGEVIWYGRERGTVRALDVEVLPPGRAGYRFQLETPDVTETLELGLYGEYNVDNCLAAAACALRLGVPVAEIGAALEGIEPQPMRGVLHALAGGIILIDDSYNSNPDAAERALESAAALPGRRRWAVLGDMLELGPTAPALHERVGRRAAELGFAPIFGVGELAQDLVAAADEAGATTAWFADASSAAPAAAAELEPGDVLLVKGSRGVALDSVVERILEEKG